MNKEALDLIYKDLGELFKHRNIICHELSGEKIITQKNIDDWTFVTIPVIQALEFYEGKYVPPQAKEKN